MNEVGYYVDVFAQRPDYIGVGYAADFLSPTARKNPGEKVVFSNSFVSDLIQREIIQHLSL